MYSKTISQLVTRLEQLSVDAKNISNVSGLTTEQFDRLSETINRLESQIFDLSLATTLHENLKNLSFYSGVSCSAAGNAIISFSIYTPFTMQVDIDSNNITQTQSFAAVLSALADGYAGDLGEEYRLAANVLRSVKKSASQEYNTVNTVYDDNVVPKDVSSDMPLRPQPTPVIEKMKPVITPEVMAEPPAPEVDKLPVSPFANGVDILQAKREEIQNEINEKRAMKRVGIVNDLIERVAVPSDIVWRMIQQCDQLYSELDNNPSGPLSDYTDFREELGKRIKTTIEYDNRKLEEGIYITLIDVAFVISSANRSLNSPTSLLLRGNVIGENQYHNNPLYSDYKDVYTYLILKYYQLSIKIINDTTVDFSTDNVIDYAIAIFNYNESAGVNTISTTAAQLFSAVMAPFGIILNNDTDLNSLSPTGTFRNIMQDSWLQEHKWVNAALDRIPTVISSSQLQTVLNENYNLNIGLDSSNQAATQVLQQVLVFLSSNPAASIKPVRISDGVFNILINTQSSSLMILMPYGAFIVQYNTSNEVVVQRAVGPDDVMMVARWLCEYLSK